MIRGQQDKRGDGAEGFSHSPSTSKRRTGRDAAAWNDPELFGAEEEEENRHDRDRVNRHRGKPDKIPTTAEKARIPGKYNVKHNIQHVYSRAMRS